MCGFCGYTENEYENSVIEKMTERIAHRGPDGVGYFSDDFIALGFRRLSFFDLEHGNQPMHSVCGNFAIVFNGEIYNHKIIRKELEAEGREFITDSDTEVLLHLYDIYREGMLAHLRGMFAFVIYDKSRREIFAARDFFGIKPFYYGIFGGGLLFGSEIKSFLDYPGFNKELNHDGLVNYLSFQYSALPESMFKGVFRLPAAHYMVYRDGEIAISRYWQADFAPRDIGLATTVANIDAALKDSVAAHLLADVPIGSLLSSGTDSSYVATIADVAKTFTVGFEHDGFNEIDHAKKLSNQKGIENFSKEISPEEFWDILPKIQYHMDEPLADPAAVALYFVCKLAREHVKGVLSGEGADELFGGYGIYREPRDLGLAARLPRPLRRLLGGIMRRIPLKFKGKNFFIRAAMPVEERFIGNAKVFDEAERADILKNPAATPMTAVTAPFYAKATHLDDTTKMQFLDIHMWLAGDILLKADKMSMANSLESRVPFLDREVFAVASTIPTKYRVTKETTKYALRQAAISNFAEKKTNKRMGFPVPTRIWLRQDKFYKIVHEYFNKDFVSQFFHKEKLIRILDRHKLGREDNARKIWTIFTFLIWYQRFFIDEN